VWKKGCASYVVVGRNKFPQLSAIVSVIRLPLRANQPHAGIPNAYFAS
jgi:hypothetical protein